MYFRWGIEFYYKVLSSFLYLVSELNSSTNEVPPDCKTTIPVIKYCVELTVLNSHKVTPSGRVKENTVVTVTCSKRYVLIGSEKVTCLSSETWSTKPRCLKCGMDSFFSNFLSILLMDDPAVTEKSANDETLAHTYLTNILILKIVLCLDPQL